MKRIFIYLIFITSISRVFCQQQNENLSINKGKLLSKNNHFELVKHSDDMNFEFEDATIDVYENAAVVNLKGIKLSSKKVKKLKSETIHASLACYTDVYKGKRRILRKGEEQKFQYLIKMHKELKLKKDYELIIPIKNYKILKDTWVVFFIKNSKKELIYGHSLCRTQDYGLKFEDTRKTVFKDATKSGILSEFTKEDLKERFDEVDREIATLQFEYFLNSISTTKNNLMRVNDIKIVEIWNYAEYVEGLKHYWDDMKEKAKRRFDFEKEKTKNISKKINNDRLAGKIDLNEYYRQNRLFRAELRKIYGKEYTELCNKHLMSLNLLRYHGAVSYLENCKRESKKPIISWIRDSHIRGLESSSYYLDLKSLRKELMNKLTK